MQHRKRKDPTSDDDDSDNAQNKSYVLTEDHSNEPAKKLPRMESTSTVTCYNSSSSSSSDDDDNDEHKQPETDVVMILAPPVPSSSGPPAQSEVFTKDQYVILILAFLAADQRILVSEVNRLFSRCSKNGSTSAPQTLSDDESKAPAVKVAALYKACIDLTVAFHVREHDGMPEIIEWQSQVLGALSLDHTRTLSFGTQQPIESPDEWNLDGAVTLATKTPKLTALNINVPMDPAVSLAFLQGPRADRLYRIRLSLSTVASAAVLAECVPRLCSVRVLHLLCNFPEESTMSSVLEAIRSIPTLSEFVLKWHRRSLSAEHVDALRCLLEKHKHTLTKTVIGAGVFLDPDFSLWLLQWAGKSRSLVDFTANTFYNKACIRAAIDTVTQLSGQLQHFHVCANSFYYWIHIYQDHGDGDENDDAGTVPVQLLSEFIAVCRSAPTLVDCSIDDIKLPVRDLRNGCVSSTLTLPSVKSRLSMVEVAHMYSVFFDGCPTIKQVVFTFEWQDVDAEAALANLMHHLPAVQNLCGDPRTDNLAQIPSVLIAACVSHPTWQTVSVPIWEGTKQMRMVHTKDELADHDLPLKLLDKDQTGWTICALALREHPRILIDASHCVPTADMLSCVYSSIRKRIDVNIVCTGPTPRCPEEMMDFADAIDSTAHYQFRWTENDAPIPLLPIPPNDELVIRSSMRNTVDYLHVRRVMTMFAQLAVVFVYDSVDPAVNANDVFLFFRNWLVTLRYKYNFTSYRFELEGPASLLPPSIAMYPISLMTDAICDDFVTTLCVPDDHFSLKTHRHVEVADDGDDDDDVTVHWTIQLKTKGRFIGQFATDIWCGAFHFLRPSWEATVEVVVESLDELAKCVWCIGQGTITIFRMQAPGSSLEQFQDISEQFEAIITPCIHGNGRGRDSSSSTTTVFNVDTDSRQLVCTITIPDQDEREEYAQDRHMLLEE
jgi:hypothetical protein